MNSRSLPHLTHPALHLGFFLCSLSVMDSTNTVFMFLSTIATNGPATSSKNAMILRLNELGEIVATLTDESEVAQIKDALEAMKAQPAQEDLEDEGSGGELDDETKKKLELSTFHANSNIFKSLVRMIFNELMGLPKTSSAVPPYPEDESAWPMNEITKQRHLRFHWDKLARDRSCHREI
ncbi:hypothetical protein EDD85DRAFT_796156 [Armillaria nabsnona]|nr:hypothetical protein EDD85DRAFT_796156 [Armillaria nabsnona]